MQKDRHNIYTKEELLKMIKDGKNVPADMDEFELEALEGLKLLEDTVVLNKLNKEVDEIIVAEKKKETQRKTIYYFSAAASLLLIISLIFLFRNEVVVKNEKVVASAEKLKEENMQLDLAPPAKAEATTTYESKELEQEKTLKKNTPVLASRKEKRTESEPGKDNNIEEESSLKQTVASKNISESVAKDESSERKEQEIAANQSFAAAPAELKADKVSEQQEQQNKLVDADKAKKAVTFTGQSSMAFQSNDQATLVTTSPAAPKADSKKEEDKIKADLFYANNLAKSKIVKNYKEASFIKGDSAFAAYVKQNLKISAPDKSGIIVVEFVINKDGTTSNIEVLKALNDCDACSKDVIDFIRSIKKWQPAIENGKAITAAKKISLQYN